MSRSSNFSSTTPRDENNTAAVAAGVPMSLQHKLDLLESRFTQPGIAGTNNSGFGNDSNNNNIHSGGNFHPSTTTTTSAIGSASASNSQHSFSFGSPTAGAPSTSNLPPSAVRSKRRPSLTTSTHAIHMGIARHIRKVAGANSPTHGFIGSNLGGASNTSCSSSNHTLITSHVQQQHPPQRQVAETPPTTAPPVVSPTTAPGRNKKGTQKPTAARNLYLHPSPENETKSNGSTQTATSSSSTKRKSNPKRKQSSIKDKSSSSATNNINSANNAILSPENTKRAKTEPSEHSPQRSSHSLSEHSRDRSNLGNKSSGKVKNVRPANNKLIHDFFSATRKRDGGGNATDTDNDSVNTATSMTTTATTNNTAATTTTLAAPTTGAASSATITTTTIGGTTTTTTSSATDWQAKYVKLQQVVQDKDEQLKAVTNNKTILHTALQTALEKTKKELANEKAVAAQRQESTHQVLEDLLRWKSTRQAKELRETLATDGARLGRIVCSRAGMRAVESWEEGYATKDLEQRKAQLKDKRRTLEARFQKLASRKENQSQLEAMEGSESIRMHLEGVRQKEKELLEEEQALNDEKGAHIRALKRVASEDGSRFRSRPKLHDRYVLHCLLGKGGFSEVWRGYDLQELREVAVKIHQLDPRWPESKKENYTKHVSREYEIHRNVRHPRIVSLFDVFEIDNNSFATVLECCKGTDLDTLLKSQKRLAERKARAILLQILAGMNYLSQPSGNRQGIIHYDLKPGNILFDEFGDAKITDFGLSKIIDAPDPAESMELTSQGAGTYWYLPPECFVTGEKVRISNKVDVWSIGVVYYQMLYGVRPFGEGKSQDKLLTDQTMLHASEVHFPEHPSVSNAGKDFIRQCLMYDQAFRPSIAQLCENAYVLNTKL